MKILAAAALSLGLASSASALTIQTPVIDTFAQQNTTMSSWGYGPATERYGQTFTLSGISQIDSFDFLINDTGTAITYNAFIYEWNGSDIVGAALHQSSGVTAGVNGLATVSTSTNLSVVGGQYIAFLEATGAGFAEFGSVFGADALAGGQFVFQDTFAPQQRLAPPTWGTNPQDPSWDLAFRLNDSGPAPVPVPAAFPLLAGALGAFGLMRRCRG